MKNFTNGALVFRIWRFDGTGEILGKFQYMMDAIAFAKLKHDEDAEKRPKSLNDYFYLAVCESESEVKSFMSKLPDAPTTT